MTTEAERTIQAGQWRANVFGRRFRVIGRSNRDEFIWVIEFDYDGDYELTAVLASELVHSKLIRNADGTPAKPPEPEPADECFTTIRVVARGDITAYGPNCAPEHATSWTPVWQGRGWNGWTCEGYQFAEDPDTIYPNAQGWIDPDPDPTIDYLGPVVSMVRYAPRTTHVIATTAVWRRLGA